MFLHKSQIFFVSIFSTLLGSLYFYEHNRNKSSEFKMTQHATANRFSLASLMAPVVASIFVLTLAL